MADDKNGREKQARDAERRQQERDVATDLKRGDESAPPLPANLFDDLESALESLEFPAVGTEVIAAVGDHEIESGERAYTIEELLPATDTEPFDSPAAVSVQIRQPRVAGAMKRVVEASETLPNIEFPWSQRKAFEQTFQELKAIDADDDDEMIQVMGDWIIECIREKEQLPGSRAIRRQAAKFCRENGYAIRDDQWLGI
jgi:hypothetical protein